VLTSHGIRLSHLSMGFAELMRRAAESRARRAPARHARGHRADRPPPPGTAFMTSEAIITHQITPYEVFVLAVFCLALGYGLCDCRRWVAKSRPITPDDDIHGDSSLLGRRQP
jgi:hypothetical protein